MPGVWSVFLQNTEEVAVHVHRECERDEGMVKLVKDIQGSDPMAAALLIECRGRTTEALEVLPFAPYCLSASCVRRS